MSLPSPTCAFTIPSVHDDTILSCRLYLPRERLAPSNDHETNGAIIAHPYAPLGGCYDDPVVESLGGVLLGAGYVIATFNFRGASDSAGRTSWSAKPELGDYVSVYGFMIHYLNGLESRRCRRSDEIESTAPSDFEREESLVQPDLHTRLILAGYSYGSMIASHLPGVECVARLFEDCAKGTAESEIQLRASHLSSESWKLLDTIQERDRGRRSLRTPGPQSSLASSHSSSSVVVGGFESEAAEQRIDRGSRRSTDVRKSVDRVRERMHTRRHRLPSSSNEAEDDTHTGPIYNIMLPQICYLLISPVLPPAATLATFFSTLSFKGRQAEKCMLSKDGCHELAKCPSLAIYGSKDFFTSVKKVGRWGQELSSKPGSTFRLHQVDGAGHFWREPGVLEQMKKRVREWMCSL